MASASDGWRILIDDDGGFGAVCTITPLSAGGYSMLAPYHAAKNGWLCQHKINYQKKEISLEISDMQYFVASDRVKLSQHPEFVQFSGMDPQKIISGQDAKTDTRGGESRT